jgi:hypothetical protein
LSCGDEEESVSDSSSMQHGIWANSAAEWPHFPFIGKPGLNIDLEDPSNPLGIFWVVLYIRNCRSNSQRKKLVCPEFFRKHA